MKATKVQVNEYYLCTEGGYVRKVRVVAKRTDKASSQFQVWEEDSQEGLWVSPRHLLPYTSENLPALL